MSGWLKHLRTRWIERQVYKWLMKMLDDPGRYEGPLERWLSKDPERRAIYWRVSSDVGRASDKATELPSLRVAANQEEPGRIWSTGRRALLPAAALAVAAAVIFLVGTNQSWRQTPAPDGDQVVRMLEADADDRSFELPDGSTVLLYRGASARVRFVAQERAIDLVNGRARFTVQPDATRPFVVHAAGGTVTATGTVFEVSIDNGVHVRLVTGVVEVKLPSRKAAEPGEVVPLGPGEQISYETDPQAQAQPPAPTQPIRPERQIESFDDVEVAHVVGRANAISDLQIEFADPAFGRRRIFGDLDIADANALAQKLATFLGLVVDRSQPGRLVLQEEK